MKTLLVIDMQKGFMKNNRYKALNKRIESLISNSQYDKVIFTKFINNKSQNPLYEQKIGWKGLKTKKEQEFSLKIPTYATIMEKYGYGLEKSNLEYIKSLNLQEIDVCGVKSEACVYAIALQLWDAGIYPNILINYVMGDTNMKDVYIKQFGGIDSKEYVNE